MSDVKPEKLGAEKEKLEAQVKSADMTDEMQSEAIEVASEAVQKYTVERVGLSSKYHFDEGNIFSIDRCFYQDIAQHIKKEFDVRKGATWHCIVGRNFGSFVTHETKHFIYFYLGHVAILLFKTQ